MKAVRIDCGRMGEFIGGVNLGCFVSRQHRIENPIGTGDVFRFARLVRRSQFVHRVRRFSGVSICRAGLQAVRQSSKIAACADFALPSIMGIASRPSIVRSEGSGARIQDLETCSHTSQAEHGVLMSAIIRRSTLVRKLWRCRHRLRPRNQFAVLHIRFAARCEVCDHAVPPFG